MKDVTLGCEERPCLIFGAAAVPKFLAAEVVQHLGEGPLVLAADAGWKQALACGLPPQLVVGDFDSGERPEGEAWGHAGMGATPPRVLALPAAKDDTDLHFAARQALHLGVKKVVLLGVLGGRLDHSLASLATLLFLRQNGADARIVDAAAFAYCILPGESLSLQKRQGVYLSVFPIGEKALGVYETGVKYPLQNAVLTAGYPLGVSNEFAAETAVIRCESGGLYVLLVNRDASIF